MGVIEAAPNLCFLRRFHVLKLMGRESEFLRTQQIKAEMLRFVRML